MGINYYYPSQKMSYGQMPFSENSTYQDYSENVNKLKTQNSRKSYQREYQGTSGSLRASRDFYTEFENNARSSKSLGFQIASNSKDLVEKDERYQMPMTKQGIAH